MSLVKQQLAYNLNLIIFNYTQNNNINKFYKKLNKLNTCIFKNNSNTLYNYYKNDIDIINTNIINKNIDITFINDFIYLLKKIILELLYFE
jgi:hypothetical protein